LWIFIQGNIRFCFSRLYTVSKVCSDVHYLRYLPSLIGNAIDIINWYGLEELIDVQAMLLHETSVDKNTSSPRVNQHM